MKFSPDGSFVRTNISVLYGRGGRGRQNRKFGDMDMDDMMTLCQWSSRN